MRKIIVVEFLSLDGVMQAPGASEEDRSEGFEMGGWTAAFFDDETGQEMAKQMKPADLLLGRKTFDIFESYWPEHEEFWPGVNQVTKYAVSHTKDKSTWNNTKFLKGIEEVRKLKETEGLDLQIYGSAELVQELLQADLVDELWLKIFPVTLGKGKKLFSDDLPPMAYELTDSKVTKKGVIFAYYGRNGEVKTGEVG